LQLWEMNRIFKEINNDVLQILDYISHNISRMIKSNKACMMDGTCGTNVQSYNACNISLENFT
jgi:hypothetical protein